ncbi:LysR family transcriptional regulator [Sphingomonas immobilis]|uniref:LysR substrate-binding domain-containing protein n=1 Tax=Sphingomonas immobilis TaxID=3063997 RepID=A0ABT9A386_9SPHN|nr:LysR substrate-binding domain-containing protein [Sphingomonas sp. CA1-15]MDO7843202.1 LysR substrate-binding domain-containing protein [Sphingomonas sp. CA1-15]
MELRHLRYFVQVAQDLHFARAAGHLGISQPPLSQQIRALEDELGVRLLERTSRRVALTPAGRLFLDAARATLRSAEDAILVARRASRGELGELAIGFSASAPFVPDIAHAISEFRDTYPDIALVLREIAGSDHLQQIEDHVLDLAFQRSRRAPVLSPALMAQSFLSERLFVACQPEHRFAQQDSVRFAELNGEPLLVYSNERTVFTGELILLLREYGVEPVIAQSVTDISTLFGLTAAGIGVMVLVESLCTLQSARLVFRPLADETARIMLWLVRHREPTLPCRNFLEMLGAPSKRRP